jgi:4-amino-4-deoxy-L-arabinose transferase-like glycosyltransferase
VSDRRWLAAVVVLALAVRLVVVLATPGFRPQTDAADYDRIAVSLADVNRFAPSVLAPDGGPSAFRPPMFPVALAAVYKLSGTGSASTRWEAGRILEALLGAATVALTFLIALRLWTRRVAVLCAAIAAVYPPLVLIGSSLMSESLYIPLVLGAVLTALVARAEPARWRWVAASGVLVGLAALTRSNGIALLVPVALLVWGRPPRLRWPALRAPVILLAAALLSLVPWTIRNLHAFHGLVPVSTESGYAFAGTYDRFAQTRSDFPAMWVPPVTELRQVLARDPHANESQISSRLNTTALNYVKANPASVVKAALWNTLRLFDLTGTGFEQWAAPYEAYPPWLSELSVYAFWLLLPFMVVGAFTVGARAAPVAFWLCPVVILLSSVLLIGATRYRSPADPFLLMLGCLGLLSLLERRRRRSPVATRREPARPLASRPA